MTNKDDIVLQIHDSYLAVKDPMKGDTAMQAAFAKAKLQNDPKLKEEVTKDGEISPQRRT